MTPLKTILLTAILAIGGASPASAEGDIEGGMSTIFQSMIERCNEMPAAHIGTCLVKLQGGYGHMADNILPVMAGKDATDFWASAVICAGWMKDAQGKGLVSKVDYPMTVLICTGQDFAGIL